MMWGFGLSYGVPIASIVRKRPCQQQAQASSLSSARHFQAGTLLRYPHFICTEPERTPRPPFFSLSQAKSLERSPSQLLHDDLGTTMCYVVPLAPDKQPYAIPLLGFSRPGIYSYGQNPQCNWPARQQCDQPTIAKNLLLSKTPPERMMASRCLMLCL